MAVYEQVSKELAALTRYLDEVWNRVGRPNDCSSESGWTVVKAMVRGWENFYSDEVKAWKYDRTNDLLNERSLSDLSSGIGYNIATYPPTLYQMFKIMLPDQDLKDKKFLKRLTSDFPVFKSTNLKI
jgi:hypothetical protein